MKSSVVYRGKLYEFSKSEKTACVYRPDRCLFGHKEQRHPPVGHSGWALDLRQIL